MRHEIFLHASFSKEEHLIGTLHRQTRPSSFHMSFEANETRCGSDWSDAHRQTLRCYKKLFSCVLLSRGRIGDERHRGRSKVSLRVWRPSVLGPKLWGNWHRQMKVVHLLVAQNDTFLHYAGNQRLVSLFIGSAPDKCHSICRRPNTCLWNKTCMADLTVLDARVLVRQQNIACQLEQWVFIKSNMQLSIPPGTTCEKSCGRGGWKRFR